MSQIRESFPKNVQRFFSDRVSEVKSLASRVLSKSNEDVNVNAGQAFHNRLSENSSSQGSTISNFGKQNQETFEPLCVGCSCECGPFDCESYVCRACVVDYKPASNILLRPWFGALYLTPNQKKKLDIEYGMKPKASIKYSQRETEDNEEKISRVGAVEWLTIDDGQKRPETSTSKITSSGKSGNPMSKDLEKGQFTRLVNNGKLSWDFENGPTPPETENGRLTTRREKSRSNGSMPQRGPTWLTPEGRNSQLVGGSRSHEATPSRSNRGFNRNSNNNNDNIINGYAENRGVNVGFKGRDHVNNIYDGDYVNKNNSQAAKLSGASSVTKDGEEINKCGCFLDQDEQNATFPNQKFKTKPPSSSCPCKRVELPEEWYSKYKVLASGYVELPHGHLGRVDIMGLDAMLENLYKEKDKPRESRVKEAVTEPETEDKEDQQEDGPTRSEEKTGSVRSSRDHSPLSPIDPARKTGATLGSKGTTGTQLVRVKIPEALHESRKKQGFHSTASTRSHQTEASKSDRYRKKRRRRRPNDD